MPLQETFGNVTTDAYGGGVAAVPQYIEDVFSTYLYTGNSGTQTISNGIDLSTKGGMVWIKARQQTDGSTSPIGEHGLWDTNRGVGTSGSVNKALSSNSTSAENLGYTDADYVSAFNTTGFTVQNSSGTTTHRIANHAFQNYASWTFRKQPKFFDVVTYTGTGANRTISHSLGSVPACIIVKKTGGTATVEDWQVYHQSLGNTKYMVLNTGDVSATGTDRWNSTTPTSTVFSLGTATTVNENGNTYVAYLFASDAGGFGLTGTDNVISCGSFTTDGSGNFSVNLGYEPQWVLVKATDSPLGWSLYDNMRGMPAWSGYSSSKRLAPNSAGAESTQSSPNGIGVSSTGFSGNPAANNITFIYIAIRKGPMKVPTSGTSVFAPVASRSSGTSQASPIFNAGFPVDWLLTGIKAGGGSYSIPRLTVGQIGTSSSSAETSASSTYNFGGMLGVLSASGDLTNATVCGWNFRRAPSFFDVVCYTGGTGTPRVLNHNLTVAPELLITRVRNFTGEDWVVHYNNGSSIIGGYLNNTTAFADSSTAPSTDITNLTSTTYTLNTSNRRVNGAYNYVAYLFATCAGVSKVGSYTGNGTTQTINCGFGAGGARFVLIKRTDSTGDWYVYDTARGMTTLTDPYLLLNSTAAESATLGSVTTVSTGFAVNASILAAINTNGASYIFLAIA